MTLDVERDFRQPLSGFDKSVKLEAAVGRQGVERTCLGDGDDVVRLRIDPEFRREKVLQQKDIAQLGHFDGRLQSVRDVGAVLERETVAAGRCAATGQGGAIQIGILILQIVRGDFREAIDLLSVVNFGVEPERDAPASPIIEFQSAHDFLADRESDLAQK